MENVGSLTNTVDSTVQNSTQSMPQQEIKLIEILNALVLKKTNLDRINTAINAEQNSIVIKKQCDNLSFQQWRINIPNKRLLFQMMELAILIYPWETDLTLPWILQAGLFQDGSVKRKWMIEWRAETPLVPLSEKRALSILIRPNQGVLNREMINLNANQHHLYHLMEEYQKSLLQRD